MPVVTSEWGKLMNTMEALGAGPNLSPKGETPGLNLGADAEALALFASLFAMMQTQQQNGATAGPVSQAKPQSIENKPLLPAAAMLMAELAPKAPMGDRQLPLADMLVNNPETGEGEPGDTAGLLKLLLAAHDIAAPDHQPMMPAASSDDNVTAAAPTRTATEMLTSAIEILKSLEAGATPSGPIKETPDQISTPPASAMVLQADPNFIGPMPAVAVPPTQSAPALVMLADPDFVGPMPAITPPATLLEYAVILPAEPDFIGPMPVIKSASTVKTADASYAALNDVGPAPAGSRLAAPVTKTTELVPNMATIGAASVTATQIETSPETARLSASAAGPSTVPNSSSTPAPPNAPSQGPAHSAVHGPNPDLHPEPEQLVKSGLPKRSTSEKGADKDDGFISRRAGKVTAGKDMNEKMAIQQKAAEIQAKGARMMSKANDLLQGSAASASTSVQALAQQTAVTSQAGNMMSSASASDITQNVAAGAAGGQSGGQSGSQQPGQHLTDGGMARGTADRTLLHRLNIDNAGWSESLVKRLTADLRSGVQNVRIILEPRQLGRLNVELGLRNGQASIRIAAETQEAAKLLSGARGQLGQMLESAGLRLAGFQATGSQAGDTGLDTGQGSQGRGGEEASDNAGRNNAGRDKDFSNKMASASDDKAKDLADGDSALREGETAVLSILA